jgi:hypothetical protein
MACNCFRAFIRESHGNNYMPACCVFIVSFDGSSLVRFDECMASKYIISSIATCPHQSLCQGTVRNRRHSNLCCHSQPIHAVERYFPCTLFLEQELKHAQEMMMKAHSPELVTGLETQCRQSHQHWIEEGKYQLGFVGYVGDDTFDMTESF